jgi:hypothetical protein
LLGIQKKQENVTDLKKENWLIKTFPEMKRVREISDKSFTVIRMNSKI